MKNKCVICDKEVVHSEESKMFVAFSIVTGQVHVHCYSRFENSSAFVKFIRDKHQAKLSQKKAA